MHGCRSEGKFKIHELPQEQVRGELEIDGFLKFLALWNSCKDMGRTRSNLNQNMQMIGQNHTREQELQLCRRNFVKKTNRNTSNMSLK